jgi:hypothetical protein
MIQDIGYYYNEFNIEEGSSQLKKAILNHDLDHAKYKIKNIKLLERYMSTNISIIEQYDLLLDNVMNANSVFRTRSGYDWKTNTVEI